MNVNTLPQSSKLFFRYIAGTLNELPQAFLRMMPNEWHHLTIVFQPGSQQYTTFENGRLWFDPLGDDASYESTDAESTESSGYESTDDGPVLEPVSGQVLIGTLNMIDVQGNHVRLGAYG